MLIELQATHSLCPLTRLLPLASPLWGQPSVAHPPRLPPFRLWLILLNSVVDETAAHKGQGGPVYAAGFLRLALHKSASGFEDVEFHKRTGVKIDFGHRNNGQSRS